MKNFGNIISISRRRISTDGNGVRSLIAFGGCPLRCKYCLNDFCHDSDSWRKMTVQQVMDEVMKDELYYRATNGGITFGGGEPCLVQNSRFIMELIENGLKEFDLAIETSLGTPIASWFKLTKHIKTWFVDIKDLNDKIYNDYCFDNKDVKVKVDMIKFNLKMLKEEMDKVGGKIVVRVPHIPRYNTYHDVEASKEWLKENGFENIDEFDYTKEVRKK